MSIDEPYFMSNDDWYYFDSKEGIYKLTEFATVGAKESYDSFYELLHLH